jgi:hypothetical protein
MMLPWSCRGILRSHEPNNAQDRHQAINQYPVIFIFFILKKETDKNSQKDQMITDIVEVYEHT